MSSLADYPIEYIDDMPLINPNRVGRTFKKMSAKNNQSNEAAPAYNKSKGEHRKDIVIAVLVAGIIAFIGGMTFQSKQQSAIETAVNAVTPTAQAQEVPVKK
jgi:hypothetical protein